MISMPSPSMSLPGPVDAYCTGPADPERHDGRMAVSSTGRARCRRIVLAFAVIAAHAISRPRGIHAQSLPWRLRAAA